MKKLLILFLVFNVSLLAETITIAVAANVSYAIDELKREFLKTHPTTEVRIALGSSGKLTAQIKNGAPYGLFMSANMKYSEFLYQHNIAITEPVVYAQGTLALLSNKKRDLSKGVMILSDAKIKRIAIANPKTAPYGIAAKEALTKAGIYLSLKKKFVYGESISQTLSYTVTATDIGVIAKSALYSPRMKKFKGGEHWISLKTSLYKPIKQGVVLLKKSGNIKEYKEFYDFILSEKAREIFKKYGYII